MTEEGKNIKNYTRYLVGFALANIILYLLFTFGVDIAVYIPNEANMVYITFLFESGIITAVLAVLTFILNGLLTSNIKASLVFWKRKNALPGYNIFTNLSDEDSRIDKSILKRKYGELPVKPHEQNRLWYKIYKQYEYDPMIFDSQRNFLISRDMASLSIIFIFIFPLVASILYYLFNIPFKWLLGYVCILIIQYVVLMIVSRNWGNRFAFNVLAKSCADDNSLLKV